MNWLQERNHLQHGWLSHFLVELGHLAKVLDDRVEHPGFEECFFQELLPQWQERREDVMRLAETFESEMSPQTFFEEEPLRWLPNLRQPHIVELIHGLWVGRTSATVAQVRAAVYQVDSDYAGLTAARSTNKQCELIAALGAFQQACLALRRAITELPITITLL
ncbi:MAG: hypothetical protein ABL995_08565 [Bryobacteraceae bacterium]